MRHDLMQLQQMSLAFSMNDNTEMNCFSSHEQHTLSLNLCD